MLTGGGNQFGIVVEFIFRAYPYAGPFSSGIMAYPGSELSGVLKIIQVHGSDFIEFNFTNISLTGVENDANLPGALYHEFFSPGSPFQGT